MNMHIHSIRILSASVLAFAAVALDGAVPFARPDAMRGPKLRDVRLKGLPAVKMNRFFQARLLSESARSDIFGEARSAGGMYRLRPRHSVRMDRM